MYLTYFACHQTGIRVKQTDCNNINGCNFAFQSHPGQPSDREGISRTASRTESQDQLCEGAVLQRGQVLPRCQGHTGKTQNKSQLFSFICEFQSDCNVVPTYLSLSKVCNSTYLSVNMSLLVRQHFKLSKFVSFTIWLTLLLGGFRICLNPPAIKSYVYSFLFCQGLTLCVSVSLFICMSVTLSFININLNEK